MRAAYIESFGDASTIRVGDLPDPIVASGQLLVRVEVSAVNSVDTFLRSGRWRSETRFPLVVGRDLVGVVVAVGDGVHDIRLGQWVWSNSAGYEGRDGAAAELVALERDRLYPLPLDADPAKFVASVHPGATAYGALIGRARLQANETIAIYGANGAVGLCLIQIAAAVGARVVAMVRSDQAGRELRRLGAERVIVCAADEVTEAIKACGIDVFIDTSGRVDLAAACAAVRARGRVVVIATRSAIELPLWKFYTREVQLLGFVMSAMTSDELAAAASWINTSHADRRLEVPVGAILPLDDAAQAHHRVETGDFPACPTAPSGESSSP